MFEQKYTYDFRGGIVVVFLCFVAGAVGLATRSLVSSVGAGLIGFIVFFAINSLVSDTNLWPMLGNLLTMLCVNEAAGDGECVDVGSLKMGAPVFAFIEKLPLDASAEIRADSVDTYGVWVVGSLTSSSSNFGMCGNPSVIFFNLRTGASEDELLHFRFNIKSFCRRNFALFSLYRFESRRSSRFISSDSGYQGHSGQDSS